MEINLFEDRHCEKAFSADSLPRLYGEAIFIARISGMIDCFVVSPRNDALFWMLSMVACRKTQF